MEADRTRLDTSEIAPHPVLTASCRHRGSSPPLQCTYTLDRLSVFETGPFPCDQLLRKPSLTPVPPGLPYCPDTNLSHTGTRSSRAPSLAWANTLHFLRWLHVHNSPFSMAGLELYFSDFPKHLFCLILSAKPSSTHTGWYYTFRNFPPTVPTHNGIVGLVQSYKSVLKCYFLGLKSPREGRQGLIPFPVPRTIGRTQGLEIGSNIWCTTCWAFYQHLTD